MPEEARSGGDPGPIETGKVDEAVISDPGPIEIGEVMKNAAAVEAQADLHLGDVAPGGD